MKKIECPPSDPFYNKKAPPDFTGEQIAEAILGISNAMKRLSKSRLKREAIVALIQDKSKLGKATIEMVLNNLESLEETWLKKEDKR
jgi:hypothetical protein